MFYGIEQTTDLRYRETVIRRFRSESTLREWLGQSQGQYAWPGAADERLPASQQNWHRRLRTGYRMPKGWRLKDKDVQRLRAGDHRSPYIDLVAALIKRSAIEEVRR